MFVCVKVAVVHDGKTSSILVRQRSVNIEHVRWEKEHAVWVTQSGTAEHT